MFKQRRPRTQRLGKVSWSAGLVSLFVSLQPATAEVERMVVQGDRDRGSPETILLQGNATDVSDIFKRVAGGSLNENGPLSNIPQYRGLFGPRLNVRVNGKHISPSGPVWMDPPLHYAPVTLIEDYEFQRGVAPVSTGSGLGGHLNVRLKQSEFAEHEAFVSQGSVVAGGHAVDEGYNLGVLLGLANHKHRTHVFASRDFGDDAESGNGRIGGTEYERDSLGLGYGYRQDQHHFSTNYHRVITGDAGVPGLPLDIEYFHGDFVDFSYQTQWGVYALDIQIAVNDISHKMSNDILRTAPDIDLLPIPDDQKLPPLRGTERRLAFTDSKGASAHAHWQRPWREGTLKFGLEAYVHDHNMELFDPDVAPFFVDNFNDVEVQENALFVEWSGAASENLEMYYGIRYAHVRTTADPVDALPARLADNGVSNPVTNGFQTLRNRFNDHKRTQHDDNVDLVVSTSYYLSEQFSLTAALAQKMRSPNYVERYLWVPLEISSGLGDGNNYMGDPDLDSETLRGFEVGFDWFTPRSYFSPRFYHWWVNDYIQGVDVGSGEDAIRAVSRANGDINPKQFANVDAKIYGMDFEFGHRLSTAWYLDGIASMVRGRRRDIDDNLFRISPPQLRLALTREFDRGNVQLQTTWVAEQDKLANSLLDVENLGGRIDTTPTPGYALVDLAASYRFPGKDAFTMTGGVNNLFDKFYRDHNAGFNRSESNGIPVGQKIPGPGRNLYMRLSYQW